ncbi:hypothetical protein Tco_0803406 [Tanacetum coccineum]|uniref:Reverse transcriptase domain-containing protein n=1 Tax=Tanacetum coccineum TaxID=301880 RepID=A0ABQ5A5V8_9ASTR
MDLKQSEVTEAKSSIEEPPELELKDLPSHLEYAYLEENDKLPIIIAKGLKNDKKEALINVLKSRKRAIAWKITDIKGKIVWFVEEGSLLVLCLLVCSWTIGGALNSSMLVGLRILCHLTYPISTTAVGIGSPSYETTTTGCNCLWFVPGFGNGIAVKNLNEGWLLG